MDHISQRITEILKDETNLTFDEIHTRRAMIEKFPVHFGVSETREAMRGMIGSGVIKGRLHSRSKMVYRIAQLETVEPGWRPTVVSIEVDDSPEKMYLVCLCGEAFDDIKIAADHAEVCGDQPGTQWVFDIQPESEAL